MVPKQPPPNFFAPYPASSPRSKLFMRVSEFYRVLESTNKDEKNYACIILRIVVVIAPQIIFIQLISER